MDDVGAVNQTVAIGRENPLDGMTPDGAELAILETYLSLPDTCEMCDRERL
jgi:hypothetical protein